MPVLPTRDAHPGRVPQRRRRRVAVGVIALAAVVYALRVADRDLDEARVPLLGVCAAFIFAAQMLNFPVAGGTSGHFLGATLAAVLLGPWVACLRDGRGDHHTGTGIRRRRHQRARREHRQHGRARRAARGLRRAGGRARPAAGPAPPSSELVGRRLLARGDGRRGRDQRGARDLGHRAARHGAAGDARRARADRDRRGGDHRRRGRAPCSPRGPTWSPLGALRDARARAGLPTPRRRCVDEPALDRASSPCSRWRSPSGSRPPSRRSRRPRPTGSSASPATRRSSTRASCTRSRRTRRSRDYAFPGVEDERVATGLAGFVGTLGVFALGCGLALVIRRRHAGGRRPRVRGRRPDGRGQRERALQPLARADRDRRRPGAARVHRLDPRAKIVGLLGDHGRGRLDAAASAGRCSSPAPRCSPATRRSRACGRTSSGGGRASCCRSCCSSASSCRSCAPAARRSSWARSTVHDGGAARRFATVAAKATIGTLSAVAARRDDDVPGRAARPRGDARAAAARADRGVHVPLPVRDRRRGRADARRARCARLPPAPRAAGRRRSGRVATALFLRTYGRGERVYLAMLARGYRGAMPQLAPLRVRPRRRGVRRARAARCSCRCASIGATP